MKSHNIHLIKTKVVDSKIEESIGSDIIIEIGMHFKDLFFEKQEGDLNIMFCFLNDFDLYKLINIFEKYDILIEYKDVTSDIILGNTNMVYYDVEIFSNEYFIKLVKLFSMDNLTIDMILDKININGMDSLSEIDKNILEA
jgi:hypothetical protein